MPVRSEQGDFLIGLAPASPMRVNKEQVIARVEKACSLTAADVKAALDALEYQVMQALMQGRTMRLGDFGSFRPTVKNGKRMVTNPDDLSAADVAAVRVRFTPSAKLRKALNRGNGITFDVAG